MKKFYLMVVTLMSFGSIFFTQDIFASVLETINLGSGFSISRDSTSIYMKYKNIVFRKKGMNDSVVDPGKNTCPSTQRKYKLNLDFSDQNTVYEIEMKKLKLHGKECNAEDLIYSYQVKQIHNSQLFILMGPTYEAGPISMIFDTKSKRILDIGGIDIDQPINIKYGLNGVYFSIPGDGRTNPYCQAQIYLLNKSGNYIPQVNLCELNGHADYSSESILIESYTLLRNKQIRIIYIDGINESLSIHGTKKEVIVPVKTR